ncbi:MAG: cupin domain-containing protein [Gemmatimonadota bacterium]|nr:cupin domain-containing protein [Gemmatimonadota bacterium]MDH5760036.1 cupin domain-containing protein [Gemmatimonadota bacterium]
MEPTRIKLADVPQKEIVPGYRARMIHTEHTTHAYWEIEPDRPLPEHAHPHEQIVNMIEGTFVLTVAGVPHELGPGDVFHIPGGVPHSGVAKTPCKILDVFSPVREEYR